jgi:toxin CcdB
MAQFDVHRNRGQTRDSAPFFVTVQSAIYDAYDRRVVVPLMRKSSLEQINSPQLNPTFVIDGIPVVLNPLEIFPIPKDQLGKFVQSLSDESNRIIDALDELITRAYG